MDIQYSDSPCQELLQNISSSVIFPNHVITVRRWKKKHEKDINNKIRRNIIQRRKLVVSQKEEELRRKRKTQLDELAKDWLENLGGY